MHAPFLKACDWIFWNCLCCIIQIYSELNNVIEVATYTPAPIFSGTSGRKRPKRIERHIQSRDSGTRIMRWKIGPAPAQTDRKNVLPVTKYEEMVEGIRYRW